MRGLNLDHLHTFADVVALQSFSAAAGRLGISQPAVSLQVRALEQRFGAKLVERVGRRVVPTAAGEEFLSRARAVVAALDTMSEAMLPHASGTAGRVRVPHAALSQELPDLGRRDRDVDVAHTEMPEGVNHRIHDGGRGPHRRRFSNSLGAQGMMR